MIKLLLGAAVVAGLAIGGAHLLKSHPHPPSYGPTVITVKVPNPLGGSAPSGNGGQIVVP